MSLAPRLHFGLKELLLAACLISCLPEIKTRLANLEGFTPSASYLLLFFLMWAALIGAAYVPVCALRISIGVLLAVAAYSFNVYAHAMNDFMTYNAFLDMLNSAAFVDDAWVQYRTAFIGAAGTPLLYLAALAFPPSKPLRTPTWLLAAAPFLGVGVLSTLLFARGGEGSRGLPPMFTPSAYATLAVLERLKGDVGPRQPVSLPLGVAPQTGHVVLIIDESISGQYLDINSDSGVATPLSSPNPPANVYNYGLAASVTNCSVGSNLTLRHGGTRDAYNRINSTMPSIWAYARQAGRKTAYIDAQRTGGALQNLMTEQERSLIDDFIQFGGTPVVNRDMAAADTMLRLLKERTPYFILINKVGAHFPIHDKYPDDHMRYRPVLPRGKHVAISDTGSRAGFDGNPESWVRYRNSYRNTLLWNVGAFFDRVLRSPELERTTIIYTADHGQNLHERGDTSLATHCSSNPAQEEGAVPLLVVEGGPPNLDWRRHVTENHNRMSHAAIFPTLLALMGYDSAEMRSIYGPPLTAPSSDPLTFNAYFNARLNRKPVWVKIDPTSLAQPPTHDYHALQAEQ